MPLLEVVTRCYKRPKMLLRNILSLQRQSVSDWEQTFLVDDVGLGIGASYKRLAHHAPVGEWLWILDDDDECIYDDLVFMVSSIALEQPQTQVIMVRMDHGSGRVLPDRCWGHAPQVGEIGISAFVVRREVWQAHAGAMVPGEYISDYKFISSIYQSSPLFVYWWDVVASKVQRQSLGDAE